MMRLLLDQNLSPTLVGALRGVFEVTHVRDAGLASASDEEVWAFAREHDLTIVTKDADYSELVHVRGPPRRVVWLRLGTCDTLDVERALRARAAAIADLCADQEASILLIDR
jgi:predicted nuclease of predicted toxin-antitoxin system